MEKAFISHVKDAKKTLRKSMRLTLAGLDAGEAAAHSLRVSEKVIGSRYWKRARTVLAFMGMSGEFATEHLICAACRAKKQVYVPRVEGELIKFYRVSCYEGPWEMSAYGIREPFGDGEAFSPDNAAKTGEEVLVLTPGLAFDARGGRLGHGKGYYDKFFACMDKAGVRYEACGLAFPCQIVEDVPLEPFDKRLAAVFTY
jgi:5-formyltetrahydrofolate cyclo-ligase